MRGECIIYLLFHDNHIQKLTTLNKTHFSSHSFHDQKSRYGLAAFPALGSLTSCNQGVSQAGVSSEDSVGERLTSKALWLFGRTHFFKGHWTKGFSS